MPAETLTRPAVQPAPLLQRIASFIERRPNLVLPVWIAVYLAVLWRAAHRPLWYDELFTYYVSMSPTFERFIGGIRFVDLNPPLSYFFVRSSIYLFGDSPFVTRLPSMLGFLIASLVVFRLVTRRMGAALGFAALGILWSFSLTAYAVEARPYGLLLALFSIATLCWLNAVEAARWTKWHTGLAASIVGMLLTHCFSPVFAGAIGVGELVRAIVLRRIDKRVWAALLAPLSLVPLYIPLIRNAQSLSMPHAFEATLSSIPLFYLRIALPVLPVMGVMLVLWIAGRNKNISQRVLWRDLAKPHEIAFSIAALVLPTVIIAYCIASGVAWWDRYGICAAIGGCLILTALLAAILRRNVNSSAAAAVLILILFCFTQAGTQLVMEPFGNVSTAYRTNHPELPFVAACGLTFLEMDHRESPDFVSRLYYLTDKESAFNYVHASAFDGYAHMRPWFPIRANIFDYHDFVAHNRHFLVLATPGCPLEWLLLKLKDDGARIQLIQDQKTGYRDRNVYEVTLPPTEI
jgi:hypothetical protein